MAKTSQEVKARTPRRFAVRTIHRCNRCGRRRAYIRRFQLCRICFRELALRGEVPGVTKASW